jgi:anaerobic ribonucleoside-triphosphate reductase activating protein
LGCFGCFNPETHLAAGGKTVHIEALFGRVLALGNHIEGITISGGEPLQQFPPVLAFLQLIRAQTSLSALLFTGYSWHEVKRMPLAPALFAVIDVLIAGRYDHTQRAAAGLLGSTNKTIHLFTDRYTLADLKAVPAGEILIQPDGDIVLTGIDPPVSVKQEVQRCHTSLA